jgi:cellulose 1,4-beta-cellobiosidase
MDQDGGLSKYPGNKAGAKYGTGYCDAQCPRDIKFINGEGNVKDWNATGSDTGTGSYGSCCTEMDIWEANSMSTAYTAHACTSPGQTRCEKGVECGDGDKRFDGMCDKNGCDIQPFRLGNKEFFGKGSSFAVDTTKPMTVVTQFITEDATDSGALKEIRRHYVQDGKKIESPKLQVGSGSFDSISSEYCQAEVGLFKDSTNFLQKGGLKAMDDAATKGMVLVMSLWDDHDAGMLWLDSNYPAAGDVSKPGVARGTCSADSGDPAKVEVDSADASVTFSNIKVGDIGSTDGSGPSPSPGPSPGPSPTPSSCPGGTLSACIGLCPSDAAAFKACVASCQHRCPTDVVV